MFDCVLAGCDELVRGVVLVGGNQQSAAEARAGFGDGAAERVFVAAAPARRGETGRASTTFIPCRHAQRHIHCDIFTGVSPSRTQLAVRRVVILRTFTISIDFICHDS